MSDLFEQMSDRPANLPPVERCGSAVTRRNKAAFDAMTGRNPEIDAERAAELAGARDAKTLQKPSDNTAKLIRHFMDDGYTWVWKCETQQVTGYGDYMRVIKRDMGGFADYMAMRLNLEWHPEIIAIQECAKGQVNAHVQKCSKASETIDFPCSNSVTIDKKRPKNGTSSIMENVLSFLRSGGIYYICWWEKDDSNHWQLVKREFTEETMQRAIARQHK